MNSFEYMDYENCKLFNAKNQNYGNDLEMKEATSRNFSWIMTDGISKCCFEVCSDRDCTSKKVNIGIEICLACNSNYRCNVKDRWHYWHLDFNIRTLKSLAGFDPVLEGNPLDCSISCNFADGSFGCKKVK